jgi:hypothetical protein
VDLTGIDAEVDPSKDLLVTRICPKTSYFQHLNLMT